MHNIHACLVYCGPVLCPKKTDVLSLFTG